MELRGNYFSTKVWSWRIRFYQLRAYIFRLKPDRFPRIAMSLAKASQVYATLIPKTLSFFSTLVEMGNNEETQTLLPYR